MSKCAYCSNEAMKGSNVCRDCFLTDVNRMLEKQAKKKDARDGDQEAPSSREVDDGKTSCSKPDDVVLQL